MPLKFNVESCNLSWRNYFSCCRKLKAYFYMRYKHFPPLFRDPPLPPNAIFMYATNPQQWGAQSTGKTGVAPIKSFLHYSWRWKPAIMLPPVLNTLHAFVKTFRRHFKQLVCNRWCIIEQTSDIQHNKDRYCCSVCVFCRKHASLPTGIALNMCVVLKML